MGLGRRMTLRAGLALLVGLVLSAGMVMAAGPRPFPAPGRGADEPPVATMPDFIGWSASVRAADAAAVVVSLVTVNGTFEVEVDEETHVLRVSDGQPMPAGDLAPAMPLIVEGRVTSEARIAAAVVSVGDLPPTTPSERLTLRGRVLATFGPSPVTAGRNLLVITTSRGEAVLEVDAATLIVDSEGLKLGFGDLHAGAAVLVEALGTTRVGALARSIEVSTAGRAPQVTVDGLLLARGKVPDYGERWIVGEVMLWVPAGLARENEKVAVGTRVSVTAQRGRLGELEAVRVRVPAAAAPSQTVWLRGRVERLEGSSLVVDSNRVRVDAEMVARPGLAVGVFVKVRARLDADGTLTADDLEVLKPGQVDVQFEGPVESLTPEEWWVAGVTVRTEGAQVVGDPPTVGSHAEVTGVQLAARVVSARRIRVTAGVTPAWAAVEGRLTELARPPAVWRVVDRNKTEHEVLVSETTIIDESWGARGIGEWVQVWGQRNEDNRIEADVIRVRSSAQ